MSMNFKRAQIVASEADIIVKSAMYLIPEPNQKFRIVVVDDAGNKRYLSGSGLDGKSAYEVAVQNGYIGTETEWLDSLKGNSGPVGASSYEIAVANGFSGTESQWLESIKGQPGSQGIQGPPGANGLTPTIAVGSVTSLPTNQTPTITNTGTSSGAVFNFGIPKGENGLQGPQGVQGPQGSAGPKGDKGDTGNIGPQGIQGLQGQTGATGPKGDKGDTGNTGTSGSNAQSFNYKGNVANYNGLPTTASQNDAYYNQADQKWYIYNGASFPADGQGVILSTDPNITQALGSFAVPPGDQTIKNYGWDDSTQTLFGISPQAGLLRSNNTLFSYSESGYSFRVWLNIPTSSFDKLIMNFTRVGGSLTNPQYVNLIGRKQDGTLDLLIKPNSDPATQAFETVTVDLEGYSSISVMLTIKNTDTVRPSLQFIKKGGLLEYDSVKKYIDENSSGSNNYIDLINFGCKGDGVTDDTVKINQAISQLVAAGGGTIYGRTNKYKVTSISIPNSPWIKIEILGGEMPVPQFGTIGTYDVNMNKKQMEFISDLQNPNRGVIHVEAGTAYDNFNFVFLSVKNLRIRTYQNPNCHGINALNAVQLNIENVYIDTGVYNVQAVEPTNGTTALIIPHNSNGAFNYIRYFSAQGFDTGIDVYEHTDGDQICLHSCKHGLVFKFADHASYFKRVLGQRNANQVTVEGSALFEIAQLNCEYVGDNQSNTSNAWQKIQYELNDPNNLGIGSITYANVRGAVGKVPYFRINGGNNVIVKRIGSETRLTGTGLQDPNPIN